MNVHELAQKVPNYPGRAALERALGPLVEPLTKRMAVHAIQRLLGFWALTATYGDVRVLVDEGLMSRSVYYKQRSEFTRLFGRAPEEFMPELSAQLYESGLAVKLGYADKVRAS
ncbi:MAG: hypothetical protein ACXWNX_12650 [Isosphaeraceae bacterium]